MDVLLIDNYDSFTYNLVHLIERKSEHRVIVIKNDEIDLNYVDQFQKILLSPGPGLPKNAGKMPEVIQTFKRSKSIFGVCLGLQAIGENFGAQLKNLDHVMHGIASPIEITSEDTIFEGIPKKINVGRYHSWVVNKNNLPNELQITSIDENGEIMALKHKELDVKGVQFHPESILTEYGEHLMNNWLNN
jgi:anthranilate synthase component 2